MPSNSFVAIKNQFLAAAKSIGEPLSQRQAHRIAQGFIVSQATEHVYGKGYSDDTGEEAVKNVLIAYLRKYGSLSGPMAVAA